MQAASGAKPVKDAQQHSFSACLQCDLSCEIFFSFSFSFFIYVFLSVESLIVVVYCLYANCMETCRQRVLIHALDAVIRVDGAGRSVYPYLACVIDEWENRCLVEYICCSNTSVSSKDSTANVIIFQ